MDILDIIKLIDTNSIPFKTKTLQKGEWLLKENTIDNNIYIIENGVLIIYSTTDVDNQIVRFGYQHNIIVALDSFLKNCPTIFSIQALKKSTIKVIQKIDFDFYLSETENGNAIWIQILENLILQQLEREQDLLINDPQIRYERVLNRRAQLFQEVPNKYIANYLRMSPETFSRIKK